MPKKTSGGIPKSVLADINRVKARITALEKSFSSMGKEWKTSSKGLMDRLKKYDTTIASLGKRSAKKAKRKPSEYNLFLKDKMSQGMSMIDAVKAWKEKDSGMSSASTSSSRETESWQSSTQES